MGTSARTTEIAAKTALFLLFSVFVHLFVTSRIALYEVHKAEYYKIQDFHYYLVVIKSFWHGEIPSIYDPASQVAAIGGDLGEDVTHAMPLGISPTALLILLPFSIVAGAADFPFANTLWVSVSVFLFAIAVLRAGSLLRARKPDAMPAFLLVVCIFLFSFRTVTVIFLGQASLLACALLLFLVLEMIRAKDEGRPLRRWLVVPAVFVLSMKMHYFAMGMGLLLIGGYLVELVVSAFLVGLSLLCLVAGSGPGLMTGFVGQLSLFSSAALPAQYNLAGVFHTFITFRSAFAPIIGESLSLKISVFVLSLGGLSIAWMTVSRMVGPGKKGRLPEKVTVRRTCIAWIALLLLFLPYIGGYEDVLLFVPFAIVFSPTASAPRTRGRIMAMTPLLFLVLNQAVLFPAGSLWIFWAMKTFVLSALVFPGEEPASPGEACPS